MKILEFILQSVLFLTDMDWSMPFTRDISFSLSLNQEPLSAEMKTQIKDQFVVLCVAMKSGHVVLWQVDLPLSGR